MMENKNACKSIIYRHFEMFCYPKSREDRIRTCDPLVPNQVFYRAELPPELLSILSRPSAGS